MVTTATDDLPQMTAQLEEVNHTVLARFRKSFTAGTAAIACCCPGVAGIGGRRTRLAGGGGPPWRRVVEADLK